MIDVHAQNEDNPKMKGACEVTLNFIRKPDFRFNNNVSDFRKDSVLKESKENLG